MARPITVSTLVRRIRQRCDQETSGPLDEGPEWKALVSEYYAELHAIAVEKSARIFETEVTVNLASLALPSDHLTTIGLSEVLGTGSGPRRRLRGPLPVQLRDQMLGLPSSPASYWGLQGANLELYPLPTSGTYKHLYVPQPTDYSTATDATLVDVLNIHGERAIIWGAASVAQHKSKESQQRALDEYGKAIAQFEYWACQRRSVVEGEEHVQQDDWSSHGYRDAADYRVTRP